MGETEWIIIAVAIFQLAFGFALGLWFATERQRRRQVVIKPPVVTVHPDSPMGQINQAFDDFGKRLTAAFTEEPTEKAAIMREEAVE